MMNKRLHWSKVENKSFAYNNDGENVGYLSYERVGAYMHWCWYQEIDFRMSPGCLQEVRDMQKELIKEKITSVKEDYKWFTKNDFSKYAGKWIAIYNKKVIAFGLDSGKVMDKARKLSKESILAKIPNNLKETHEYIQTTNDVRK